ncbi:MAG: hypothetical protein J07HR59_00202 [Halorubrum sp. J07HR59]|nr:MAG: hypothetical protein J07HR59_00202 [Halorubrum sp. J07HR59]
MQHLGDITGLLEELDACVRDLQNQPLVSFLSDNESLALECVEVVRELIIIEVRGSHQLALRDRDTTISLELTPPGIESEFE